MLALFVLSSSSLYAQFNGGNISSPYSIYGIGDLRTSGTATSRSMGGAGIADRDPILINMYNPAALSIAPRQTFLFSIGAEGVNNYLSTSKGSTSKNAANLGYIALRFPIAKKLGFGFSMSPFSSTGYAIRVSDVQNDIVTDIGSVNYYHQGSGDIGEYKIGLGWEPLKGFSVGANLVYYLGTLKHSTEIITEPFVSNNTFANISRERNVTLNKPSAQIGLQYHVSTGKESSLVLAATYMPRIESGVNVNYFARSILNSAVDTIYNKTQKESFALPQTIAGGISYNTSKLKISLDYKNQSWKNSFGPFFDEGNKVSYTSRNEVNFGIQYIPNRYDIRSFAKRLSYRAGVRYSNSYMKINGHPINEYAISAGVGIPFASVFSSINVGVEYGMRGTKRDGMIKTNFFNFFIDINLFADSQWFVRHKFE